MIIDFRLFNTIAELRNHRDILKSIENQESFLSESKWNELMKYIKSLGLETDEVECDLLRQQYDYETDYLYPKALRGAFLISLWATFEAGILEIARLIQISKGIKLKISDIRAENILDQFTKYFTEILEFDLGFSNGEWTELKDLYFLRNCYAHTNGRIDAFKENEKNKFNNLKTRSKYIDEKFGYVVVEMNYLHDIYEIVSQKLEKIIEQYKKWDDEQRDT